MEKEENKAKERERKWVKEQKKREDETHREENGTRQNKTQQSKNKPSKTEKKETVGGGEDRQSSCISSCHLRSSDQCLIITSTPTACWDSPACPPSPSPSSSPSAPPPPPPAPPQWVPHFPLRWHNPSLSGAILQERQAAAGNGEKFSLCVCECVRLRVN